MAAAEHLCYLLYSLLVVEASDTCGVCAVTAAFLVDEEVGVALGGYLWQVGDVDDLHATG